MKKSFWVVSAVFFTVIIIYSIRIFFQTDNYYCYILDDTFIHMAVAKNFAFYGNWGVTKYVFSSSSSSPLFTTILAFLIDIFGNRHLIPLFLNIILGFFLVLMLNRHFARYFDSWKVVVTLSLVALFSGVMHVQVLSGMEHVMQVFIFAANIFYFLKLLDSDFKDPESKYWFFFSIAMMGLIRFESMFYVVAVSLAFVVIKKYKQSLLVFLFGLLPIAVFCYFNYRASGYLFPFSVMVKGTQFSFSENIPEQLHKLIFTKFLFNSSFYKIGLFPIVVSVLLFMKDFKAMGLLKAFKNNLIPMVLVATMILHPIFADLKGFFRYEAYIVTGFVMVLAPRVISIFNENFKKNFQKIKPIEWSVFAFLALMIYKFAFAHLMLWNGGKNIYEQQVQSARFLKKYYNNSKIVANDIGAVSYYTDIELFDTAGLGSSSTVAYMKGGKENDAVYGKFIHDYTKDNNYELAIIYDEWLHPYIPKRWKKVARLQIEKNISCAYDHVFVYSIDPDNADKLRKNVKKFGWNKNVKVQLFND